MRGGVNAAESNKNNAPKWNMEKYAIQEVHAMCLLYCEQRFIEKETPEEFSHRYWNTYESMVDIYKEIEKHGKLLKDSKLGDYFNLPKKE